VVRHKVTVGEIVSNMHRKVKDYIDFLDRDYESSYYWRHEDYRESTEMHG
jgi:hypothetical protein